MKKIIILLLIISSFSCTPKEAGVSEVVVPTITSLPPKTNPASTLMTDSVIKPYNLDHYLFLKDCIYIDLRSPREFYREGHVAGFINVPFYGYVADITMPTPSDSFFKMMDGSGSYLGDVGSFVPRYEYAEQWLLDTFPRNKNIVVLSTAGVEGAYFLNLLVQYGYNPERLYNAGSFSNGMGEDIAYRLYEGAKYLVPPFELYDTVIEYSPTLDKEM